MQKRLFIALKPSKDVLDNIASFQKKMITEFSFKGVRWVKPDSIHLTLLFLGNCEINQIPTISSALAKIPKDHSDFLLSFKGLGWFGQPGSLRTLWIGTKDKGETEKLYRSIISGLRFMLPNAKPRFVPHLTLARITNYVALHQQLAIMHKFTDNKELDFGVTRISAFSLIESQLTPSGSIYKTLSEYNLV